MMMTDLEILTTFRQAKEPGKQVRILAELNGTTTDKIREILKEQGVDPRQLPRKKRKAEPSSASASCCHPEETQLPDAPRSLLAAVAEEEHLAEEAYKDVLCQIDALNAAMSIATAKLNDIRAAREALERFYGKENQP